MIFHNSNSQLSTCPSPPSSCQARFFSRRVYLVYIFYLYDMITLAMLGLSSSPHSLQILYILISNVSLLLLVL